MNDSLITFSGNLGGPVDLVELRDDVAVATLRVGSTPRRMRDGRWEDGETVWFTVKAWRQMARNVAQSLRTGDPVLVTGRMSAESWTREDGTIVTQQVVVAVAVGHDLTRGVSSFSRARRSPTAGEQVVERGDDTTLERRDGAGAEVGEPLHA